MKRVFSMAFWLWLLWLGMAPGESPAAGLVFKWRQQMPNVKTPSTPLSAAQSAANLRVANIPLKDLPNPAKQEDQFGLRFQAKYQPENLADLIDSIKLHGLMEPPVVAKRKDGAWDVICGHRRGAALHCLADRGTPGFTLEMSVPCLEVLN